jgi:hypothetical protein
MRSKLLIFASIVALVVRANGDPMKSSRNVAVSGDVADAEKSDAQPHKKVVMSIEGCVLQAQECLYFMTGDIRWRFLSHSYAIVCMNVVGEMLR